jgi:hypothetical protein
LLLIDPLQGLERALLQGLERSGLTIDDWRLTTGGLAGLLQE